MSDVIGRGILETVVDNTDLKAGMADAVAAVKQFEQAAGQAGTKAGEGLGKSARGVEEAVAATTKLDGVTKRYMNSLEREISTLTLSRTEYRAWEAQVKNISEGVYAPLIKRLGDAKVAQDAAAKSARDLADAQRQAAQKQESDNAFVAGLQKQAAAIGKTRADMLELEAAQRGLSAQTAPYIAQLRASEVALNRVGGVSRATAAALRNVPAQFTDIVVSLQAGQSPLTVFLQQGGQLKDMFGGAGEAARVLGRYILSIIGPFTLAAGAVATLGAAYYKGSQEAAEYSKAIIMTGNYAGVTKDQLNVMARSFRDIGISQGAASEALSALVGSGKVAAGQLNVVAQAALGFSKVMGVDLKTAIEDYVRIAEEPAKASAKLNEQYHFLTQSIYEQIKALEEQGRKEEAAALAQTTYANAMNQRVAEVKANLGTLETAWAGVQKWAKLAWDAMLDVGRDQSFAQKYTAQMDRIAEAQKNRDTGPSFLRSGLDATLNAEKAKLAEMDRAYADTNKKAADAAKSAREQQVGIIATDDVKKWQDRAKGVNAVAEELKKYRDRLEDIRKVNPDSALLDPKAVKAGEDAIRKANQGSSAKPKVFRDDEATKYLLTLRQTQAQLQEQLDLDEKITGSQRERAKFEQLINDLKTKGTLTADQKSLLLNQEAIKAQLDKNVAIEDEVVKKKALAKEMERIAKEEARAYEAFQKRQDNINMSIASRQEDRSGQYQRSLESFGQGDRLRQQVDAQRAIFSEFQRYQLELDKATPANLMGGDEYMAQVEKIKQGLGQALEAQKSFYSEEEKMRLDWSYGATRAFANYLDSVKDVAGQTEQIFGNAFKNLEDTIFTFAKTGKASIKGLFGTITDDLLKSGIKTGITGPIAELLQGQMANQEGVGGGIGSYLSTLFGGGGAAFRPKTGNGALTGSASTASTALQSLTQAANAAALALGGQRSLLPGSGAGSSAWGQIGKGLSSGNWGGLFNSVLGSGGQAAFSGTALGASGFGTGLAYGNMDFGGFLANGGPANPGRGYRVLENGPELLTMQNGKSMLMMTGNQAAKVTPVKEGSDRAQNVTNVFHLAEPASRQTQVQIAAAAARGLSRGRRNS